MFFSEEEDRTHCSGDCGLGGPSSAPSSWKKHLLQDISGNVKVSNRSILHDSLGLWIFSFTDRHQTTPNRYTNPRWYLCNQNNQKEKSRSCAHFDMLVFCLNENCSKIQSHQGFS